MPLRLSAKQFAKPAASFRPRATHRPRLRPSVPHSFHVYFAMRPPRAHYTLRLSVFFLTHRARPSPYARRGYSRFFCTARPLFNRSSFPSSPPPCPRPPSANTSTLTSLRLRPYLSTATVDDSARPSSASIARARAPLLYNSTASPRVCSFVTTLLSLSLSSSMSRACLFPPAGLVVLFPLRFICPDVSRSTRLSVPRALASLPPPPRAAAFTSFR